MVLMGSSWVLWSFVCFRNCSNVWWSFSFFMYRSGLVISRWYWIDWWRKVCVIYWLMLVDKWVSGCSCEFLVWLFRRLLNYWYILFEFGRCGREVVVSSCYGRFVSGWLWFGGWGVVIVENFNVFDIFVVYLEFNVLMKIG